MTTFGSHGRKKTSTVVVKPSIVVQDKWLHHGKYCYIRGINDLFMKIFLSYMYLVYMCIYMYMYVIYVFVSLLFGMKNDYVILLLLYDKAYYGGCSL